MLLNKYMNAISLSDPFSISAVLPHGLKYTGLDIINNPHEMMGLIAQDHGLDKQKKKTLMTMLKSPEAMDHIVIGVAGMAISHAVANYAKLSSPAKTLLSLAGFGIGNILYNTLHERKFTTFDPATGVSHIKL